MEENYRGYKIHCEAAPIRENGLFKSIVKINWNINGNERVMVCESPTCARSPKEAEGEGLAFGKKWIDDHRGLTSKSLLPLSVRR